MMRCPKCGKSPIKTAQGLIKHLTGKYEYGGHELDPDEASRLAMAAPGESVREPSPPAASIFEQTLSPVEELPLEAPGLPMEKAAEGSERVFLDMLFAQMAGDKALPKYQFERRVDAILALLLPDLLAQTIGGRPRYVASEFPLKKASSNQSTNVDHLYFDDARKCWSFCEIKTDRQSIQDGQVSVYLDAAKRGMRLLVEDIRRIQRASNERGKYAALLERVERHPLDHPMEILYLSPDVSTSRFGADVRLLSYSRLSSLQHRTHPTVWDLFRRHLTPVLG